MAPADTAARPMEQQGANSLSKGLTGKTRLHGMPQIAAVFLEAGLTENTGCRRQAPAMVRNMAVVLVPIKA